MPSIHWAPLVLPLSRRLQTAAVFLGALITFFGPLAGVTAFVLLLLSPLAVLAILYVAFWYLFDFDRSSRGGRRFEFIRKLGVWRHYCNYFPIRLVKSCDLPGDENYIMCYHPHGVISSGAFGNFGTDGSGFSSIFPGIKPHLLTLKLNFRWPFHRDFLLALGLCDVSKESINKICTHPGGGNAAVIVVGGAAESLEAVPGAAVLTLKDRKGFVRMALKTGLPPHRRAHLVPMYSFGENDLFNQARNPWLRAVQEKVRHIVSVAPVMFYGRGIFQYDFGLMPFRVPVTTVVGAPIRVKKVDRPSQDEVDQLHSEYIHQLTELFEKNKAKYSRSPEQQLKII